MEPWKERSSESGKWWWGALKDNGALVVGRSPQDWGNYQGSEGKGVKDSGWQNRSYRGFPKYSWMVQKAMSEAGPGSRVCWAGCTPPPPLPFPEQLWVPRP
jgi:hypothetical protein